MDFSETHQYKIIANWNHAARPGLPETPAIHFAYSKHEADRMVARLSSETDSATHLPRFASVILELLSNAGFSDYDTSNPFGF